MPKYEYLNLYFQHGKRSERYQASNIGQVELGKWETSKQGYRLFLEGPEVLDVANELGKDGWELVTVFGNPGAAYLWFKRPLP